MTSISKNMYIYKLDDIVNKYNNTYHDTIEIKPIDVKSNIYIDFDIKNNNVLSLKLEIMLEYRNIKIF